MNGMQTYRQKMVKQKETHERSRQVAGRTVREAEKMKRKRIGIKSIETKTQKNQNRQRNPNGTNGGAL